MKTAGIQMSAGTDGEKNVARAVEMTGVAAEKGAKVIGFPELWLTTWFPKNEDPAAFALACEASDAAIGAFVTTSLKHQVVLVLPFFEKQGEKYYNSAAVIDCSRVLGIYRKQHLPDIPYHKERFYFSPGNTGFPVFETSRGRIGVQTCWDNLFPEGTRVLALKGADIVEIKNAIREIYDIVRAKIEYYGPNTIEKGACMMQNMFPEGIPVEKYPDALILVRLIDKMCRIAESSEVLRDAWQDIAGYAIRRMSTVESNGGDK